MYMQKSYHFNNLISKKDSKDDCNVKSVSTISSLKNHKESQTATSGIKSNRRFRPAKELAKEKCSHHLRQTTEPSAQQAENVIPQKETDQITRPNDESTKRKTSNDNSEYTKTTNQNDENRIHHKRCGKSHLCKKNHTNRTGSRERIANSSTDELDQSEDEVNGEEYKINKSLDSSQMNASQTVINIPREPRIYKSNRKKQSGARNELPQTTSRKSLSRSTYLEENEILNSLDFTTDFKLPKHYLTKAPLPPKSPTFSFRSTIDLLPSSREKHGLRQLVISCLSCSLAPLACGFAMAFNMIKDPQGDFGFQYGNWRVYMYLFGCVAGGFFTSVLINFARKSTMLLTMIVMAMTWLLTIFCSMNWMLIVQQVISGICTGIVMALAQVYVAEVSIPRHRGAVSCSPILGFQIGMLICYILGEKLLWKHLAIIGICMTTPFFFSTMLCMPESPRYLIFIRPNDALATLQWIRGIESEVMEEYRDIADSYVYDRWKIKCNELVMPNFWRPLIIACGLMFTSSMAGLNSFTNYGNLLFIEISSTYDNASKIVVTSVIIVGIIISSLLIDQIGRKLVLLLSLTIMSATAFTLGLFLFLKDLHKVDSYFVYQWAAEIFCIILFTFAFGTGVYPIAWVTIGEIFGPKYKSIGVASASMMYWVSMLAADVAYNKIKDVIETGGVFWFHCVICVCGYIFILMLFKELKEQSLDRISKFFNKKHDRLVDTFIARL